MCLKKFLKSRKAQSTLEYLMISVLLAATLWLGFKSSQEGSFFSRIKSERLLPFYNDATKRIDCQFIKQEPENG